MVKKENHHVKDKWINEIFKDYVLDSNIKIYERLCNSYKRMLKDMIENIDNPQLKSRVEESYNNISSWRGYLETEKAIAVISDSCIKEYYKLINFKTKFVNKIYSKESLDTYLRSILYDNLIKIDSNVKNILNGLPEEESLLDKTIEMKNKCEEMHIHTIETLGTEVKYSKNTILYNNFCSRMAKENKDKCGLYLLLDKTLRGYFNAMTEPSFDIEEEDPCYSEEQLRDYFSKFPDKKDKLEKIMLKGKKALAILKEIPIGGKKRVVKEVEPVKKDYENNNRNKSMFM